MKTFKELQDSFEIDLLEHDAHQLQDSAKMCLFSFYLKGFYEGHANGRFDSKTFYEKCQRIDFCFGAVFGVIVTGFIVALIFACTKG